MTADEVTPAANVGVVKERDQDTFLFAADATGLDEQRLRLSGLRRHSGRVLFPVFSGKQTGGVRGKGWKATFGSSGARLRSGCRSGYLCRKITKKAEQRAAQDFAFVATGSVATGNALTASGSRTGTPYQDKRRARPLLRNKRGFTRCKILVIIFEKNKKQAKI